MIHIKKLLYTINLPPGPLSDYSIACISTSRPIYLAFGGKSNYPTYVIRKITNANTLEACSVDNEIYQLAGNLVPEPVGIYEFAGELYDIKRGVKGAPWFQLKSRIRTKKARVDLEQRIWLALKDFQKAIRSKYKVSIDSIRPHQELRNVYSDYLKTGEPINIDLERIVNRGVKDLLQAPECSSLPQHGDFCLNNLIIDKNHITVIDFEDFSLTSMPIYDYFTLSLSLPTSSGQLVSLEDVFNKDIIIHFAHANCIPEEIIKWHFLHHLLLRLGPWSMGSERALFRIRLTKLLDNFIEKYRTSC